MHRYKSIAKARVESDFVATMVSKTLLLSAQEKYQKRRLNMKKFAQIGGGADF